MRGEHGPSKLIVCIRNKAKTGIKKLKTCEKGGVRRSDYSSSQQPWRLVWCNPLQPGTWQRFVELQFFFCWKRGRQFRQSRFWIARLRRSSGWQLPSNGKKSGRHRRRRNVDGSCWPIRGSHLLVKRSPLINVGDSLSGEYNESKYQ